MISQRLETIHRLTSLSANPVGRVVVENSQVIVELTDDESTLRVLFHPFQAVRVTTSDCFSLSEGAFISPRTIMEVRGSEWIERLRVSQGKVDETATFMENARHFLIPCDDNVVEVVAWNWELASD